MKESWNGDGVRQVRARLRELSRLAREIGLVEEAAQAQQLIVLIERLTQDAQQPPARPDGQTTPQTRVS